MSNEVVFFEVLGKDGAALRTFYEQAFGWKTSQIPAPMDYGLVEGAGLGGGIGTAPDGEPGRTTFYVSVENIEAALKKIESAGGSKLTDARSIQNGARMASFKDVEQHVIGLYEPGLGAE